MTDQLAEARRQFLSGRPDLAEVTLLGVLAQNPAEVQALLALGMIASQTGRPDLAISRMEEALQIDGEYAPALLWMSFLKLQSGNAEAALRFAERSALAAPNNPDCYVSMGRCLIAVGNSARAVRQFQKAVELKPNDPGLLYEFADALIRVCLWLPASETLEKAVGIAPRPDGFLKLAFTEHRLGRIDSAEMYGRRALGDDPGMVEAQLEMARILTSQRNLSEAGVHWACAQDLGSDQAAIAFEKAQALSSIGKREEAIAQLNISIGKKPNQGAAYMALAYVAKFTRENRHLIEHMTGLLENRLVPAPERVDLLYGLGKAFDDLGEYERAIGYFDQANVLRSQLFMPLPFDSTAFKESIDYRINRFPKGFNVAAPDPHCKSLTPILIVGILRSGTSLVEQVLTCHPDVGGAGEQQFWGEIESADPAGLARWASKYADLLSSITPGFPNVVDKNPANLLALGTVHQALPNVRIIHVRRNLVDTALSVWTTPVRTSAEFIGDRESIVTAFKELRRLSDHWRDVLPSNNYLEIRYEELVAQPESVIRQMVEFCDLPWNDACLHPELNDRRVVTPSLWQVRRPINSASADRWKRYEPWLAVFQTLMGCD